MSFAFFVHRDIPDELFVGNLDIKDPAHDDFELWSPAESRTEACLFGRKVGRRSSHPS